MMLPMISAIATGRPKPRSAAAPAPFPVGCATGGGGAAASPGGSRGASVKAHLFLDRWRFSFSIDDGGLYRRQGLRTLVFRTESLPEWLRKASYNDARVIGGTLLTSKVAIHKL